MTTPPEPVVAVAGSAGRYAYLADVLLSAAVPERPGELFDRYPGLTVALFTGRPGRLVAGLRDGTLVTLWPRAGSAPADRIQTAIRLVYTSWCLRIWLASPAGARQAAAAGFRAQVGRWSGAAASTRRTAAARAGSIAANNSTANP